MDSTYLQTIGTALPPFSLSQDEAFQLIQDKFGSRLRSRTLKIAEKIFRHPSVRKRHFTFANLDQFIHESKDERHARFQKAATELACEAARQSAKQANRSPTDYRALVVNTCTGYHCPGLSSYIIESLGMDPTIPAFDLVGAGCAGAIPNLEMGSSLHQARKKGPVLGIAVEICSAVFQMEDDLSLVVSNALFGDGAAAMTIGCEPRGFEILAFKNQLIAEHREAIRFIYKNGELFNQLSSKLPSIAGSAIGSFVRAFLAEQDLTLPDIKGWAIHSGGANILDALETELALPKQAFDETRSVLGDCGNLSSPSALFSLNRLSVMPEDLVLLLAFGAGFQIQAALLRKAP